MVMAKSAQRAYGGRTGVSVCKSDLCHACLYMKWERSRLPACAYNCQTRARLSSFLLPIDVPKEAARTHDAGMNRHRLDEDILEMTRVPDEIDEFLLSFQGSS